MSNAVEADRLKAEGNEWFKLAKFDKAVVSYGLAIDANATAVLYCNRAFANVKLCFSGEALADADAALALDPANVKAHYRKATAFLQLGKTKEAFRELAVVVAACPDDANALQQYKSCEKEVKRIRFLNAIASEDEKKLSETLKLSDFTVDATYDGPRLGADDEVTKEYVMGMCEHFKAEKKIPRRDMYCLLIKAVALLHAEQNVVSVNYGADEEMTVCGDTHGQFYDLLNIFALNGFPSETNRYLFNGDFVDRGSYSVETIMALLAFKLLYPKHMFMSRGNHESLGLNRVYGFEGEVMAKYDSKTFDLFQEVFHGLPLAHLLNSKVFVTHGGLFANDGVTIDDIQKVNRKRDLPEEGLMVEMLWSDPHALPGRAKNKRGVGIAFGQDVTENFLKTNNLSLVVRSHEVTDDGYLMWHNDQLVTIFSAPNYCDQIGNKGAFIRFPGATMKPKFTQFTHVSHPGKKAMAYSSMGGGMMGM
jgi:serine/threonine-protein phosphatase 5